MSQPRRRNHAPLSEHQTPGAKALTRDGLPLPRPCHLREPHADVQFGPKEPPVLLAPPLCGEHPGLCLCSSCAA